MLYANNMTPGQLLHIPRVYGSKDATCIPEAIVLRGTSSLKEYCLPVKVVEQSKFFLTLEEDLSDVPAGEYQYDVPGVSSGILMVLDQKGLTQYAKSVTYEQYRK